MSKVKTYAVNCNDAWLNTDGDDISESYVKYADYAALQDKCDELLKEIKNMKDQALDDGCRIADLEEALRDKQALLEASEKRIAELESLTAQQLTQPDAPDALERLRSIVADPKALPRRKEWISGQQYSYVLLENVDAMVDEACRAAMLQVDEPATDNTSQQFESLDKSE